MIVLETGSTKFAVPDLPFGEGSAESGTPSLQVMHDLTPDFSFVDRHNPQREGTSPRPLSSLGIFFLNSLCAVVFTNVDNKVFRDPVRHFNPVHDAPHRIVMASQIADLLR